MENIINKTMRSDIYKIDPHAIVVKQNFNSRVDFGDINELAEQIKAQGILNPITVTPFKDENNTEKYYLVDGERRYRAVLSLLEQGYDIPRVPALFASKSISDKDALVQQLLRNEGKPFSEYELGVVYKKFEDMGLSHKEIAETLGIPRWKVDCFLAHLNRDERVQDLMKQGKITGVDVRRIYQTAKNKESAVNEILSLAKKAESNPNKKITLKDLDFDSNYNIAKDTATIKKGIGLLIDYMNLYSNNGNIDLEFDLYDLFDKLSKDKMNIKDVFTDALKKYNQAQ